MPNDRMPESEVSILLAIYLAQKQARGPHIGVSIDGAQVRHGRAIISNPRDYLARYGWTPPHPRDGWTGEYRHADHNVRIVVDSKSGDGDVRAELRSERQFIAECKKGKIQQTNNSEEYPLLRQALGQILTMKDPPGGAFLAVAVPLSDKFEQLAKVFRDAPLVKSVGIHILTVSREVAANGEVTVHGFPDYPSC